MLAHHSLVIKQGGRVRKLLENRLDLNQQELEGLRDRTLTYYAILKSMGIPVSDNYRVIIEDGRVVEESDDCGTDGYAIIRGKHRWCCTPREVVKRITNALAPLLAKRCAEVTIDPHPANWCFDEKGVMRYIDFHPARYRDPATKIFHVGFPQPTSHDEVTYAWGRYYSPLGVIRSLRFSAVRAGGHRMEEALLEALDEFPPAMCDDIKQQLAALPDQRILKGEDPASVLDDIDFDVDSIREVAIRIARDLTILNPERFLTFILELTRVDFKVPLHVRERDLKEAKRLTIEMASRQRIHQQRPALK